MDTVPAYIGLVFGLTTLLTVWFFYKATHRSKRSLLIIAAWLLLQSVVGLSLFYTVNDGFPPRFSLLAGPAVLFIISLFFTTKGREFIDRLDLKMLTWIHIVRVPVEIVLYWLYLQNTVPELMTFTGRNFDILAGLTTPIIIYYGFNSKNLHRKLLLIWNFISLSLLLNIVVNAVLSVPSPLQQFGFDQPNIAILYFPFNLLPAIVVPLVLFAHLTAIRQLWNNKHNEDSGYLST